MKKQKLKNYLKIGILLLVISNLITNCDYHEALVEKGQHQITKIEYKNINELPKIASIISNFGVNPTGRNMITSFGNLELSEILEYVNQDGKETYSFLIETDSSSISNFENLYIVKINDNYINYILKWSSTNQIDEFIVNEFTGKLQHFDTNYQLIKETDFVNGVAINTNGTSRSMETCIPITYSLCINDGQNDDCLGEICGFGMSWDCEAVEGSTTGSSNEGSTTGSSNQTPNPSNGGNAIIIPKPKPLLPGSEPPCLDLSNSSANTDFIAKMTDLNTKSTTLDKEAGYIQKPNSTGIGSDYDYIEGVGSSGLIEFDIPYTTTVTGIYHTHYDTETHLPVFSADDLYELFHIFDPVFDAAGNVTFNNPHNINKNFTYILITAHGTKLALKFDNADSIEKLRAFGEKYFGDWNIAIPPNLIGITDTDRKDFMEIYNEDVKEKFSIEKQKKRFAKFLDKNDLGLSLYQANDDFSQWEKINKSGNPTPCN